KIITGWTDGYGIEEDGPDNAILNEDMLLYINNVITLQDQIIQDANGREYVRTKVISNENVLTCEYKRSGRRGNNDFSMRPEDIYHHGRTLLTHDDEDEDHDVVNRRLFFTDRVKISERRSTNSAAYVSRILKANQ